MKVTIIIMMNRFVIIVNCNFRNCFNKALVEIFQFYRALVKNIFHRRLKIHDKSNGFFIFFEEYIPLNQLKKLKKH